MKLTNRVWIFLGIGILAIVLISLGVLYTRQDREERELINRISTARDISSELASQSNELKSQLSQAENELIQAELSLDKASSRFPELAESIEYGEVLFQMADSHHLILTAFTAAEPTTTSIEDTTFLTTNFMVNLEGQQWSLETAGAYSTYIKRTITDILEFVHQIATDDYFAGTQINTVVMSLPAPTEEGDVTVDEQFREFIKFLRALVEGTPIEPVDVQLHIPSRVAEQYTRPSAQVNITIHVRQGE